MKHHILPLFCLLALPGTPDAGAGDPPPPCADSGHCLQPRWEPSNPNDLLHYGHAVALNGKWAAVGAPGEGEVYVYRMIGGAWVESQVLQGPGGIAAGFGYSLHLDDELLVVGEPFDGAHGPESGAVHVYELSGATFQHEAELYCPTPEINDWFGSSVERDGDWLVASATKSGSYGGKVVPFLRVGDDWVAQPMLEKSGGRFGNAIALHGTELIVGDFGDSTNGTNSGAVHLYSLSQLGTVFLETYYASDPHNGDTFGYSIDLDDERMVVGARHDNVGELDSGSAYVFRRTELAFAPFVTYEEIDKLEPCNPEPATYFGTSVSIDGDRIAIGATHHFAVDNGRVFTFRRGGILTEVWNPENEIRPQDGMEGDSLGRAVALDGTRVLAGAPNVGFSRGGAYLISTAIDDANGSVPCPCDSTAIAVPYGEGKPGLLGVPELTLSKPLVPGQQSVIGVDNVLENTAPVLIWGLVPGAIPFDDGTLLVADPHLLVFPVVGPLGQVGMGLSIGPELAICGVSVYFQAMVLDPGATGTLHTAQTRGLEAVIGF